MKTHKACAWLIREPRYARLVILATLERELSKKRYLIVFCVVPQRGTLVVHNPESQRVESHHTKEKPKLNQEVQFRFVLWKNSKKVCKIALFISNSP